MATGQRQAAPVTDISRQVAAHCWHNSAHILICASSLNDSQESAQDSHTSAQTPQTRY
jgi:hypothetical protein